MNDTATYMLITTHTDGTHRRGFADADSAVKAARATDPDIDGSMIPAITDTALVEAGVTDENYFQGFYWFGNRYAVIATRQDALS